MLLELCRNVAIHFKKCYPISLIFTIILILGAMNIIFHMCLDVLCYNITMTNVSGMSVLDFLPISIFELMFPQLRCSLLLVICHGVVVHFLLTAVFCRWMMNWRSSHTMQATSLELPFSMSGLAHSLSCTQYVPCTLYHAHSGYHM